jgi:hypothetical protein
MLSVGLGAAGPLRGGALNDQLPAHITFITPNAHAGKASDLKTHRGEVKQPKPSADVTRWPPIRLAFPHAEYTTQEER